MRDYNVAWSREAIYDVADIADYIEFRFGRERADRFNDEIDAEVEALGRDFRMYTGTGIYYRRKLILKKLFDPSIILRENSLSLAYGQPAPSEREPERTIPLQKAPSPRELAREA